MINNVHLSPNTSSEHAVGQLDRPCLMCVGMAAMLAHRNGAADCWGPAATCCVRLVTCPRRSATSRTT